MPEVPRRLPPTSAERLSVVVNKMAGGSLAGSTRWAQPVASAETYRPAAALAAPDPVPVSGGPLLAVQAQPAVVGYVDGTTFFDILPLPGLATGRVYFVESVVLVSSAYTNDTNLDGQLILRMSGPNTDNGTSQLFIDIDTDPLAAAQTNIYDMFGSNIRDPALRITRRQIQFLLAVNYFADPNPVLTLQALNLNPEPAPAGLVHPSTFIRATDIGPVAQIS